MRSRVIVVTVLAFMLFGLTMVSLAGEPCCSITAIDKVAGVVTARDADSGRSFQFKTTAAQLQSLRVGQKLSADLDNMTVLLPTRNAGGRPARVRITYAEPVGAKRGAAPKTENVAVTVTAVDTARNRISAKDTEGNTFQMEVNPSSLASFKVGRRVTTRVLHKAGTGRNILQGKAGHCPCGQMNDGKCWCSKCVGDPCFKIGCPYGVCTPIKVGEIGQDTAPGGILPALGSATACPVAADDTGSAIHTASVNAPPKPTAETSVKPVALSDSRVTAGGEK